MAQRIWPSQPGLFPKINQTRSSVRWRGLISVWGNLDEKGQHRPRVLVGLPAGQRAVGGQPALDTVESPREPSRKRSQI